MNERTRGEKEKRRRKLLHPFSLAFFLSLKTGMMSRPPDLLPPHHLMDRHGTNPQCEAFQRGNKEPTLSFTTRNKNTKITGFLFDIKSLWGKKTKQKIIRKQTKPLGMILAWTWWWTPVEKQYKSSIDILSKLGVKTGKKQNKQYIVL